MTVFIAIAGTLTVLAAVLLALPLRRSAPRGFAAIVAAVPASALALYWLVGTPAGLTPQAVMPPDLDTAIAQLETELQRNPRQPDGWRLIARAYAEQQRPVKARDAFARAHALAPDDDELAVEYAESRALATPERRFDAEAVALLRGVLARTPSHQRARWFLGIAQRQAGDHAAAVATWTPLLSQVDAATAAPLRAQIDAARQDAGLPPLPAAAGDAAAAANAGAGSAAQDASEVGAGGATTTTAASDPAATASANALTVQVALDPDFAARARLRPDASVFVIARVPGGPPMPVAVEKRSVRELPLRLVLDDGDGPMPTQKLSALREVEVFARLSASGDAARREGDIETAPVRVTLPHEASIDLVLGAP